MAATPTIINRTLTSANTEYGIKLYGASKIQVQLRGAVDLKYAFEPGAITAGTYFTLKSGGVYSWENTLQGVTSVYFSCATAGQIVEIEAHNVLRVDLI